MKRKISLLFILLICLFMPITIVNAATASIKVTASNSTVTVGNTFTATITVSSDEYIMSYEYKLNYDSNKLKLTSGNTFVSDNLGTVKSATKKFTFKVIAAGTSSVGIVSGSGLVTGQTTDFTSPTTSSVSIKGVKASSNSGGSSSIKYSTNNYLSSLKVEGYTLSPTFNKDINEYTVKLDSSIEEIIVTATKSDSTASINGTGKIKVSEGENKITITVTSQKGTKRTYTILATVTDSNPINVTIEGENYTVIKRANNLEKPDTYEKKVILINEVKVPGFYSEITNYSLVGLKDSKGNIFLAVYNNETDSYKLYNQISFNNLTISILDEKFEIPNNYKETTITLNEQNFKVYKYDVNSKYYLFYGLNIETGKKHLYLYEPTENTIQIYNNEPLKLLENELSQANKIIFYCIISISILLLLLFITIIIKTKNSKKRNNKEKIIAKDYKEKRKEEKNNNISTEIDLNEKTSNIELIDDKKSKKKKDHDIFKDL